MTDDENKIREDVEEFATTHDSMRLPAGWLKYIPCRYEIYYMYSTDDGAQVANCFLYHEKEV